MKDSAEVFKKVINIEPVKFTAHDSNIGISMLYNWSAGKSGSKYSMNPIEQIHALNRVSGTIDLTEHLCRLSDGYFVKNPETIASEMCLLKNTSKVLRKFAMVFDEITGSIENDGIIDAEEAACIDDCWSECKSMVETFVEECKALKYNGDNR